MKWLEKITKEVLEPIGKKRALLNNILSKKVNWISHILRRKHMTEVKEVERIRTQFLDDLGNTRRYLELKEEAEVRKNGNVSLSIEHKEEIQAIFYNYLDLLISSIFNNNNNNNNNKY